MTSRRNILLAGAGLAATPAISLAQSSPAASQGRIAAEEYWADKNGVKLWVYRKRLANASYRGGCMRAWVFHSGRPCSTCSARTAGLMMMESSRAWIRRLENDHEGYGHGQPVPFRYRAARY